MKKEKEKAFKSCLKNNTTLPGTAVSTTARSRIGAFLPLQGDGYACTTEQLFDVLPAVSVGKEMIEQVCADLKIKIGAENIRGYFRAWLNFENVRVLSLSVSCIVNFGCRHLFIALPNQQF